MRLTRRAARRGYTLLEVLIASAIAVLLLSALYFAFDLTIRSADTGRALVGESDLNRAVINRMAIDLSSPLGVLPPMSGGAIDGAAASSTSTDTTATTGTTSTATTADTSSTSTTTTMTAEPLIRFDAGVIGTGEQLIVFVSKVPTWLSDRETAADPNALLPSDAHRIGYYLHSSGKGLCRQDKPWITADKVGNSTEIDRTNEDGEVIAPEIVAILFEYSDGTGYISEWDGSQASTDGGSLTGPPRAIKATITFEFTDREGNKATKKIVHIFAIRSGVGLIAPDATTTPDAATTTTGGM